MKAIYDNTRAIDLLQSLPEVDADRIGCIGHSLGGHNSLFTAVFDERIKAVVTSCGFTSFHKYKGGDLHGWTGPRYMPLIATKYNYSPDQMPFDFAEVLAAIAPRAVFVVAPLHDDNFDVDGVRDVVAAVRPDLQTPRPRRPPPSRPTPTARTTFPTPNESNRTSSWIACCGATKRLNRHQLAGNAMPKRPSAFLATLVCYGELITAIASSKSPAFKDVSGSKKLRNPASDHCMLSIDVSSKRLTYACPSRFNPLSIVSKSGKHSSEE